VDSLQNTDHQLRIQQAAFAQRQRTRQYKRKPIRLNCHPRNQVSRTNRLARRHARATCVLVTETIVCNASTACLFRRFRPGSAYTPRHHDLYGARFSPTAHPSSSFKTHTFKHRVARASGSLLTTLSNARRPSPALAPTESRWAVPIKISRYRDIESMAHRRVFSSDSSIKKEIGNYFPCRLST